MKNRVIVFMSSYNGEKYIEEQIASILLQEDVQVILKIRDDGSTDHTCEKIRKLKSETNNIWFAEGNNIGCAQSFLQLLYDDGLLSCDGESACEDADYYAFADQDDIWDSDKLIAGIRHMETLEGPAFYYSAQRIIDENGNFIREEHCFRKIENYSRQSASTVPLSRGCTQMWNRKMHEIFRMCKPDAHEIYMHDEWHMLLAFFKAQTVYDGIPHMGYRQTGRNVIGAYKSKRTKILYLWEKTKRLFFKNPNIHEKYAKQIETLCPDIYLLTAHYRDGWKQKIQMLFSKQYKTGLSWEWRIFNTVLVLCGRL